MRVVILPDGRLAASVMVAMIRAFDTVLLLPDDVPEGLHMEVTLEEFDEHGPHGAAADRWRVYHGDPPDVRWALMTIEAARFESHFVDGSALIRNSTLARDEARLIKTMNADLAVLRALCQSHLPISLEDPRVVGVDPDGLDIRGAFEIHRLEFPSRAESAREVETIWRALVKGSSAAGKDAAR